MRRWAEFVLRRRKLIGVFWLLVIVVGMATSGQVGTRLTTDYKFPGQQGTKTAEKVVQTFSNGGFTAPYLVSVTFPPGQRVAEHEADVASAFNAVATKVPDVRVADKANTGDSGFVTKDGRTAYAIVFFHLDSSPTARPPTDQVKSVLEGAKPTGTTVGLTGQGVLAKGSGASGSGVLAETLLGALGALAVLAFVFGSLLAVLPLIVAAASIMATFAVLLPLTYVGDFSVTVEFLIALVGLGVAIDYSLLFVTRWREERHRGRENHEAVVVSMQTAGRSILFSGLTVAIGLVSLVILPVPFMRSVGIAGALIPLAGVASTLSLTPALLGGWARRMDWPKLRHENRASRAWSAWASMIVRFRWVAAVFSIAVLVGLCGVFFNIKIGMASSDSLAKSGPAYEALQTLEKGGVSTGTLTPIEVLVSTDHAKQAAAELGRVGGVERALVPSGQASNRNGMTVALLIPDRETVNSKSMDVVHRVIDKSKTLPGVIGVTGTGPTTIDFLDAVYGNFPIVLAVITILTYILLVRAFRSLLLPLKAVLLNLLSLGSAFGLLVLFWQNGNGSKAVFDIPGTGAITFWVPLMTFAFLFGLSMDYEVFILARIREEYDTTGSTNQAIVQGIGRTGRLVTSAALILFLAFVALAASPTTDLKIMATGLGFGILLDATIVRSVLVPSLVSIFGSWSWHLPASVAKLLRVARPEQPAPAADRGVTVGES
jgi:RND superfamily putative drug exporter